MCEQIEANSITVSRTTITSGDSLYIGERLNPNQRLVSSNFIHSLIMQPTGNLVVLAYGNVFWQTNTGSAANANSFLLLDINGRLALRRPDGTQINTPSLPDTSRLCESSPGHRLTMQSDGNLVLYGRDAFVSFATGVPPQGVINAEIIEGSVLNTYDAVWSLNARYVLRLQPDGNLVYTRKDGVLVSWATQSEGLGITRFRLQNGRLEGYNEGGSVVYTFDPNGPPIIKITLRDDARVLVEYSTGSQTYGTPQLCEREPPAFRTVSRQSYPETGPSDTLFVGEVLIPGQQLISSAGGEHTFGLDTTGNLILKNHGTVVWQSGTSSTNAHSLFLEPSGNLVLYSNTGRVLWMTGTASECRQDGLGQLIDFDPPFKMVVQADGNLVMYTHALVPSWSLTLPLFDLEPAPTDSFAYPHVIGAPGSTRGRTGDGWNIFYSTSRYNVNSPVTELLELTWGSFSGCNSGADSAFRKDPSQCWVSAFRDSSGATVIQPGTNEDIIVAYRLQRRATGGVTVRAKLSGLGVDCSNYAIDYHLVRLIPIPQSNRYDISLLAYNVNRNQCENPEIWGTVHTIGAEDYVGLLISSAGDASTDYVRFGLDVFFSSHQP